MMSKTLLLDPLPSCFSKSNGRYNDIEATEIRGDGDTKKILQKNRQRKGYQRCVMARELCENRRRIHVSTTFKSLGSGI